MSAVRKVQAALADRIAAALCEETPSEEIAILIAESEQARIASEDAHGRARSRALDPTAGAEAASAAKREGDDLRFELDRLASALDALRAEHLGAKAREDDVRKRVAYDAAMTERDALSEELREVYPEIERRLSDLVRRVFASDAALERVNRNLPSGGTSLATAEEVARGGREKFSGYQEYRAHRLTSRLRLPRFEIMPLDPDAWPPS